MFSLERWKESLLEKHKPIFELLLFSDNLFGAPKELLIALKERALCGL